MWPGPFPSPPGTEGIDGGHGRGDRDEEEEEEGLGGLEFEARLISPVFAQPRSSVQKSSQFWTVSFKLLQLGSNAS